MAEKYFPPTNQSKAFHCPHCGVYAHQRWDSVRLAFPFSPKVIWSAYYSMCGHCDKECLWINNKLLYPSILYGVGPAEDMPADVKADYEEARTVAQLSPRSAAALLRLALEKLMPHLEAKGKDLNAQIGSLVKKGLPVEIQQALDTLRVIGNNAVHPGELDLKDDMGTVNSLFEF